MKKFIIPIILCVLFFVNVFADSDVIISLQIGSPIMTVNGTDVEIDKGFGTTPVLSGGRTLLPIRAIIEALGGTVLWIEETNEVVLGLTGDTIRLTVGSDVAVFNGTPAQLDTAPVVMSGRTMLPIRFIAECFDLGVSWHEETLAVYIFRMNIDTVEAEKLLSLVPDYSGEPYVELNENKPFFKEYEIINGGFEHYSSLDGLGRTNICMANISKNLMPENERTSIGHISPSGWQSVAYDIIDGHYLYNRCHLIGFQLTGENDNKHNLFTGTRYINNCGMLHFENKVADYIIATGDSVIYRVTPVFKGSNLVANGVLIEAFSVNDNGAGLSLCVYCYNVQPDITIDYATGNSSSVKGKRINISEGATEEMDQADLIDSSMSVYITPDGEKYHKTSECAGYGFGTVFLAEAIDMGRIPCFKCFELVPIEVIN